MAVAQYDNTDGDSFNAKQKERARREERKFVLLSLPYTPINAGHMRAGTTDHCRLNPTAFHSSLSLFSLLFISLLSCSVCFSITWGDSSAPDGSHRRLCVCVMCVLLSTVFSARFAWLCRNQPCKPDGKVRVCDVLCMHSQSPLYNKLSRLLWVWRDSQCGQSWWCWGC